MSQPESARALDGNDYEGALEIAERWCEIRTDESYGPQGKNLGILARAVQKLNLLLSEANYDKEAMSARILNLEQTLDSRPRTEFESVGWWDGKKAEFEPTYKLERGMLLFRPVSGGAKL